MFIIFIPYFRNKKIGQSVRLEGPKEHYKKNGTPTFGGVIIVFCSTIIYTYYSLTNNLNQHMLILLLMPMVLYGVIGFIDDKIIVKKGDNKGLGVACKITFEIIWAAIYFFVFLDYGLDTTVKIFNLKFNIKFLYGILILLMFVSSANAVNLTDGIDGLASGLLVFVFGSVIVLSIHKNEQEILLFTLIVLGTIIAYLCYNFNPAKIFMGDSGSLSLGATMANMFILLKMEFLLLVVGIVFIIETLSDIIQIVYYKKTKGKRFFLMAPLHHHFELKGLKEKQIDIIFWIIGLIFALISIYIGLNYY